ncbi:hypothetical protein [Gordonia sputi]
MTTTEKTTASEASDSVEATDIEPDSVEATDVATDGVDEDDVMQGEADVEESISAPRPSRTKRAWARLRAAASWPERASRRARRVIVSVLAVVVVTGIGGVTYLWIATAHNAADRQAGVEALAAARSGVPKLLSYDYKTIDQTFPATAKEQLTGKFRDDYQQLGASVIEPSAKKDSIVTTAEVVDGSVVDSDRDSAKVLLFVNQSTTSAASDGPRLDGSRVVVQLSRVDGDWKISEFTPI